MLQIEVQHINKDTLLRSLTRDHISTLAELLAGDRRQEPGDRRQETGDNLTDINTDWPHGPLGGGEGGCWPPSYMESQ